MTSPDLTERLRTEQARQHVRSPLVELLGEAADEIDRLRARIDAALALLSWATDNDGCYCGGDRQRVCTLHLRAALTGEPDHDQP